MANYNKWTGIGRLTRDPETRLTAAGKMILNSALAINRTYKDSKGEKAEQTDYVDFSMFGKIAEIVAKHCSKGDAILIEGRLHLDKWESTNGERHQKLKVIAETFQFIDTKK